MASVNKVNRGKLLRKMPIETYKLLLIGQLKNKVTEIETGCWIWNGTTQKNGYGSKKVLGKQSLVHRASYFAFKGEIPNGMEVMHSCDVRNCINPDHLTLGSHSKNMRDAKLRGRSRNGVMSGSYEPRRNSLGQFISNSGEDNG